MEADSLRRRRADENFVVWSSGAQDFPPRLSVVVRRQFGSAVRRNRMKRLIREAFRLQAPTLRSGSYVILAKDRCRLDTLREVREAVSRLLGAGTEEGHG